MVTFINFGGFQNFVDGTPLIELDPELEIQSSLKCIKTPPFPKTGTISVTSRKAVRRIMALFKYYEAREWNLKRRASGWTTKMMRRQKKYEVKE